MSNQSVIDAVRGELRRLGQLANVEVQAHDGVVTLSGEVADRELRRVIAQEILRLPEVRDLRNELRPPPPTGGLADQLLQMLQAAGVPTTGIEVDAVEGAITLRGEAQGWFDRDAAERVAWTLPGVRTVSNEIRIPPGAVDPELAERNP